MADCIAMELELGGVAMELDIVTRGVAMSFELPDSAESTDESMPVELHDASAPALSVGLGGSEPMSVSICWPPIRLEYVTHGGVVVTHEGEPVYVLIED